MSIKRLLILSFLGLALVATPALAIDRVDPGFDSWVTQAGTVYDFAQHPIPVGFFCRDSAAFADRVEFQGVAIPGADGADTLVERIDEAVFNGAGVATTRLVVRGLSLVSSQPINTACGQFRVRATLSSGPQPTTTMTIQKLSENAGTFESRLALQIKLTFEPVGTKVNRPLTLEDQILFNVPTISTWVAVPQNEGGTRSAFVDLDGDGKVDQRLSGSAVFFAGSTGDSRLAQPTSHCATYSGTTCTEYHVVDPCECCNLPPGYQCP